MSDDDWTRRLTDAGITVAQLRTFAEALQFAAVLAESGQVGTQRVDVGNAFTAEQWAVMQEYMDASLGRKGET